MSGANVNIFENVDVQATWVIANQDGFFTYAKNYLEVNLESFEATKEEQAHNVHAKMLCERTLNKQYDCPKYSHTAQNLL